MEPGWHSGRSPRRWRWRASRSPSRRCCAAAAGASGAPATTPVYRDQLAEIEADLARGVLSPDEAEATRAEVGRRLLAAADAEAAEPAAGAAPAALSRRAAAAMALAAGGGGGRALRLDRRARPARPAAGGGAGARRRWGRPPGPGRARGGGRAAARPRQRPARTRRWWPGWRRCCATRPDDVEGHRLLARSLGALGRWRRRGRRRRGWWSCAARRRRPRTCRPAELMVLAADGYVSPEAEAALARALALDPANPVGRYFSGLTLAQGGRPDLAYRLWSALLAEGPADAPGSRRSRGRSRRWPARPDLPPPGPARGPTRPTPRRPSRRPRSGRR